MVSLICTLKDHSDEVNWCTFSAALLATCSADKTLRVYNADDFSEVPYSPLSGHGYAVHCCRFSACGRFLASCSTDATVAVWSTATGKREHVLEHPGRSPVRICALSPDSAHLVSCASDGSLALWDFTSKTVLRTAAVSGATMAACSFSPCGQLFATGSAHGDLRLWDLGANQLHAEKNAHDLGVACCAFSPRIFSGGQAVRFQLASCGQDSNLKIWAVEITDAGGCEMKLLHTLSSQSAPVLSCAFSSDGRLLASASVDKTVTIYNADSAVALLHTLNEHGRHATACAFSPASSPLMIATGSMDKTVNVWRLEEEDRSGRSEGESSPSPDEGSLISSEGRTSSCPRSKLLVVSDWSEEDVLAWLAEEGLEELVDSFRSNNIDGTELLRLTKDTLASDLQVESAGLRGKVLRKVEELKGASSSDDGVPDEFLCPVTRELMREPVVAADGYSYEREAIESWLATKSRTSPMTNLPLLSTSLTPNRSLKMAIARWKNSH